VNAHEHPTVIALLRHDHRNANEDDDADIDDMNEEELQEALDMLEKEETPQVTKVRADCRPSIFGLILMEWRSD
jgi:hypothetical protein